MGIIRRVITGEESGWNYRVESPRFNAGVLVREQKVVNAAPQLHWAIGQRFDKLREICSMRGYVLTPINNRKSKV